jgi:single-strand DNA-binding protein
MVSSTVTVTGTLTRDPELRFTAGGKGVATLAVAVDYSYQKNNEWVKEASFFNVTAWDTLGENAAASLTKGMRVIVTGRLQQRSYETQQGEKRSVVEIVADEIGPSLRWATAQVEKVARSEGGGQGGGNAGGNRNSPDPVYGDEEPF